MRPCRQVGKHFEFTRRKFRGLRRVDLRRRPVRPPTGSTLARSGAAPSSPKIALAELNSTSAPIRSPRAAHASPSSTAVRATSYRHVRSAPNTRRGPAAPARPLLHFPPPAAPTLRARSAIALRSSEMDRVAITDSSSDDSPRCGDIACGSVIFRRRHTAAPVVKPKDPGFRHCPPDRRGCGDAASPLASSEQRQSPAPDHSRAGRRRGSSVRQHRNAPCRRCNSPCW